MILAKGWKSVRTYQTFVEALKTLPNAAQIELATVTEVIRVLQLLRVPLKFKDFQKIEELSRVFHTPHRLKDRNITLNYCAAKDHHFMGRGDLLAIFSSLELPFFVQLTARYKQNEQGIVAFLKSLKWHHEKKLQNVEVSADSEFGTPKVRNQLTNSLHATVHIPNYGRSKNQIELTSEQKTRRKSIERVIGRLETFFSLEHPPFLGSELVSLHTHLCVLCDLLLASFNIFSGNQAHPHSLRGIRG